VIRKGLLQHPEFTNPRAAATFAASKEAVRVSRGEKPPISQGFFESG
jgi:hypothetical protein